MRQALAVRLALVSLHDVCCRHRVLSLLPDTPLLEFATITAHYRIIIC